MKNNFVGLHKDFIGFSVSFLCAIHCSLLPFLLNITPLVGLSFLNNAWVEISIICVSFLIAVMALRQGYLSHHRKKMPLLIVILGFLFIAVGLFAGVEWLEMLFTTLGALVISIGHIVNWKYIRDGKDKYPGCLVKEKLKD